MVIAMCGVVERKDIKRGNYLMLMSCLKETMDQMAMANSDGCVLRRKDGHVFSRALDFEVEGQR